MTSRQFLRGIVFACTFVAGVVLSGCCAPTLTKQRAFEIAAVLEGVPVQSERDDWRTIDVPTAAGAAVRDVSSYAWLRRHRVEPCAGTLVLIHGYLESHLAWMAFVRELEQHHAEVLDRYDICIPDLWGQGRTSAPGGIGGRLLEPTATAKFVIAALEARGLNPRWTLVGHSYGGPVALQTALQTSNRVVGLLLVDSLGAAREEGELAPGEAQLRGWLKRPSAWFGLSYAFTALFQIGSSKEPSREKIRTRLLVLEQRGLAAATDQERDWLQTWAREGREDLTRTRTPPEPWISTDCDRHATWRSNLPFEDMLIAYAALNLVPEHYQTNRTLVQRALDVDVGTLAAFAVALQPGGSCQHLSGRVAIAWGACDGLYHEMIHMPQFKAQLGSHAQYATIANAGHMLPRDAPAPLAEVLLSILR